jgi:hypothetical protein
MEESRNNNLVDERIVGIKAIVIIDGEEKNCGKNFN